MRNFLLRKANSLVNNALATDPGSLALLKKWDGALLGVEVKDWNLKITVKFLEDQLQLALADEFTDCDVQMHADLSAYLAMAKNKGSSAGAFKHKLHITGDANLAADCQKLMRDLDIDWEALLADYIGDTPAYRARQVFCKLKQGADFAKQKLSAQFKDYLCDEIKVTPGLDLKNFSKQVAECRNACARLEARLALLESE